MRITDMITQRWLLDILSISSHYLCGKCIGATNENSNFGLYDLKVKRYTTLSEWRQLRPCPHVSVFIWKRNFFGLIISVHVWVKLAQLGKLSFSNWFIAYVWTGENESKKLRVDANFFENGEKKLRSQTNKDTWRQGLSQVWEDGKWSPPPLPFAEIPVLSVRMWRKEFSLTWPAAMSIFWSKSKCLRKRFNELF